MRRRWVQIGLVILVMAVAVFMTIPRLVDEAENKVRQSLRIERPLAPWRCTKNWRLPTCMPIRFFGDEIF